MKGSSSWDHPFIHQAPDHVHAYHLSFICTTDTFFIQFLFYYSSNLIKEVMDGLRIYFDFTLPTLLLYNFEREQYQTVMKLVPHPAELAKETHNDEINGKTTAEDKYGVVSSSTESSPVRQVEFSKALTSTTETKEGSYIVISPLSTNIHIQILQTDLHIFP